tara:strand:- start:42 stop:623 length:582 start_codon:yes stop_codon:yes gene_type:complete
MINVIDNFRVCLTDHFSLSLVPGEDLAFQFAAAGGAVLFLANSSRYQLRGTTFKDNGIIYASITHEMRDIPQIYFDSNLYIWKNIVMAYLPFRKETSSYSLTAYGGTFFSSNGGIVDDSPGYVQSIQNCKFSSTVGIQQVDIDVTPVSRLVGGLIAVQGNDISSKIEVSLFQGSLLVISFRWLVGANADLCWE